jgi:hyperosmotically inducible protein
MRTQPFGHVLAVAALAMVGAGAAACDHPNNAVKENRPDAAANDRAAQVSNSSDNREGAAAGNAEPRKDADRNNPRVTGTTGEAISDGWITTKVSSKFVGDDVVKERHIDVDTKDGVVTLKGTVASKLEHDRAEQIARETDGVKRVDNNLMVNPNLSEKNDNHGNK